MATLRCPICNTRFDVEKTVTMPFCSDRCRYVDLGRWLDEDYGVPVDRLDDELYGDEEP